MKWEPKADAVPRRTDWQRENKRSPLAYMVEQIAREAAEIDEMITLGEEMGCSREEARAMLGLHKDRDADWFGEE